ncbi:MAG: ABC transporter ATP-binding protein/permease [Cellvibrionaceae bacterium]|nr:ABC transporter ATP-binding protein/permease [Cellvibrionaceae bacterium]
MTNLLQVSIPQHIGFSIDILAGKSEESFADLNYHIFLIIAFALAIVPIRIVSRILFFNPGRAIEKTIKDQAFKKISKLQKAFHDTHETGTLISIVNNDINGVRSLCGIIFLHFFNVFIALSLTPYYMWKISAPLTAYSFIPVVITFFIAHKATDFIRRQTRKRMGDLQALSTETIATLSGLDVIKSNQVQDWAKDNIANKDQALRQRSIGLLKAQTLALPVIDYTDKVMKLLILALGGYYLLQQELSIGELTAFLSYATLLAIPFIAMGRAFSGYRIGMASVDSIRRILDLSTNPTDELRLNAEQKQALFSQGLEFRNVSFSYPGEPQQALSGISFKISPGEKVGILGPVGSGKTTLVNCINRYLEIDSGQIIIDDKDTKNLSRHDLRSAVRTVTQEPFLFSASVKDNIYFGSDNHAQQLSLEETLYRCNLDREVAEFPENEQTLVGEKGIMLSGGQKQRLSLARAFLSPCKLLVLDNVLSAVDNQTERFLMQQILYKLRATSLLIVSHRASVLEQLDRIMVLDGGRIIAEGKHNELIENCALYRETWQIQQHSGGLTS